MVVYCCRFLFLWDISVDNIRDLMLVTQKVIKETIKSSNREFKRRLIANVNPSSSPKGFGMWCNGLIRFLITNSVRCR